MSQISYHPKPHALSAKSLIRLTVDYVRDLTGLLTLAVKRWQGDDAASMAAAVAYYLALSVFPMLLLLSSGIGMFLKFTNLGHDAEIQILAVVAEHCSPSLGKQVESILLQFEDQSLATGPIGLLGAILAAIGVFFQFERAFDRIWRVPASPNKGIGFAVVRILSKRLVAFVLLCCVGAMISAILIANVAITAAMEWMGNLHASGALAVAAVEATGTMLLNWLAFTLIYRWLPKKKVKWFDAMRSGLLVAIVWEIGRHFLCVFLIGMKYTSAYGTIGSFIALLLWFYWGVTLLFFGAEYLQVLTYRRSRKVFRMFAPIEAEPSINQSTGMARVRPRAAR